MDGLELYSSARRALALANKADEVIEIRDQGKRMEAYARQAKDKALQADAFELSRRAERRLGEMMAAQKAAGKMAKPPGSNQYVDRVIDKPEAKPTLADAGIDKNLAESARKAFKMPEEGFEKQVENKRARIIGDSDSSGSEHVSTGAVEWYTPPEILEAVLDVMGSIDCDPTSSDLAQETVKAATYYTEEDNGLDQPWAGNVFLNPPYSMPSISLFAARALLAITKGEFSQFIGLTNNATDTDWFQSLGKGCDAICFMDGRVKFYNNQGETLAARQGQVFFYWGPYAQKFTDRFSQLGMVLRVR